MVAYNCLYINVEIIPIQFRYPLCIGKLDNETGKLVNKSVVYKNTEKQNHFNMQQP